MVPLLGFVGIGADAARGYLVRARMSQALDAAALAAGRAGADHTKATTMANTLFKANFPTGYMDATVSGPVIVFDDVKEKVTVSASAVLPTYFVHLLGINTFTVGANSEVTSSGVNLEIAMVLDVTGSMAGQKILDLKAAAKNLVDIVVWDDQSTYYSKVAMVPWSEGVNATTVADSYRGPINNATKTITGATKANPVVITSANHGYSNGDRIYITGVKGMTQLNNKAYVVANQTTNTYQLKKLDGTNVDGTGYSTYKTPNTGTTVCANGGGCPWYYFQNAAGGYNTYPITTCITERVGSDAYTDVAPSTSWLGKNYDSAATCPASTFVPMTANKTTVKNAIDALVTGNSTAGQVGSAWAWYMLSPNFGSLLAGESKPAAYGTSELIKIAIIMTDGEYNTNYCNGVLAKDATNGTSSSKINCNATNGDPFTQAKNVCAAMKQKGIVIYTVGFQLGGSAPAIDVLQTCASDLAHFYQADDGNALYEAFRSIAVNIRKLRISK